jgi:hypothetical protein
MSRRTLLTDDMDDNDFEDTLDFIEENTRLDFSNETEDMPGLDNDYEFDDKPLAYKKMAPRQRGGRWEAKSKRAIRKARAKNWLKRQGRI